MLEITDVADRAPHLLSGGQVDLIHGHAHRHGPVEHTHPRASEHHEPAAGHERLRWIVPEIRCTSAALPTRRWPAA